MPDIWRVWIFVLTFAFLGLILFVLIATIKGQRKGTTEETTGHIYDGIEEYDNPMPQWWIWFFYGTVVFSVAYLILFPGVWSGVLGWTQLTQLDAETLRHKRKYEPLFKQFAAKSILELQNNPKALKMGQRLFLNNCAICHGSDARGAYGFPNLVTGTRLWGGKPEDIKATISGGRRGQMPAWGVMLGEKKVDQVAAYTRTLSGIDTGYSDRDLEAGKKVFSATCSACHSADGTGNTLLGAPNLTDDNWVYGSSQLQVMYTVRNGRNGIMPAFEHILGNEKVHLLATYIYSLGEIGKLSKK